MAMLFLFGDTNQCQLKIVFYQGSNCALSTPAARNIQAEPAQNLAVEAGGNMQMKNSSFQGPNYLQGLVSHPQLDVTGPQMNATVPPQTRGSGSVPPYDTTDRVDSGASSLSQAQSIGMPVLSPQGYAFGQQTSSHGNQLASSGAPPSSKVISCKLGDNRTPGDLESECFSQIYHSCIG